MTQLHSVLALLIGVIGQVNGATVYTFYVYTSHYTFSSSDAKLYVKIEGRLGNSGLLFLNNGQNIMESGRTDQFAITTDYGAIYRVSIGHDNSGIGASWNMQKVTQPQGPSDTYCLPPQLVMKDHVRGTTQLVYCDCWIPNDIAEVTKYFPENVDECASNPCQHEATCMDAPGKYTCECSSEWTGSHCQTDVDECVESPCENGATCANAVPGYDCSCLEGFNGTNCEADIDECLLEDTCQGGGTCLNSAPGYTCVCPEGLTGPTCTTDINECTAGVPVCWNSATCVNLSPGFSCICPAGLTGLNCGTDVDECVSGTHQCVHGDCLDQTPGYSCACATAWTGTYCDTDIDECVGSNPCLHGGVCENRTPGHVCVGCHSGWTGPFCETDLDECEERTDNVTTVLMCAHGGDCVNTPGGAFCVCPCGYTGRTCQNDVDECSANYTAGNFTTVTVGNYSTSGCENNATCVNTYGGYTCTCTAGFTGPQCQTDFKIPVQETTPEEVSTAAQHFLSVSSVTPEVDVTRGHITQTSAVTSQNALALETTKGTLSGNEMLLGNGTSVTPGILESFYIHRWVWFAIFIPATMVGAGIGLRVKLKSLRKVDPNWRLRTRKPRQPPTDKAPPSLPEPCDV